MTDNFILITDSSCDLSQKFLADNHIPTLQLSVLLDDTSTPCNEIDPKKMFDGMRAGQTPSTAQVNVEQFTREFEYWLEQGKDILYLAFSSGLSGTCASGQAAAKMMEEKYPERRIVVVDTLCASMGQGIVVEKVKDMRDAGKSLDECAEWARENILKTIHLVTVDDLMHLYRGGRVSRSSAVIGSILGIKPIITVENDGTLTVANKVRGRKQAINKLLDMAASLGVSKGSSDICGIVHGDCEEDAKYAADLVKKRFGINKIRVECIGPVIGVHTGPGVIAIFMFGDKRK